MHTITSVTSAGMIDASPANNYLAALNNALKNYTKNLKHTPTQHKWELFVKRTYKNIPGPNTSNLSVSGLTAEIEAYFGEDRRTFKFAISINKPNKYGITIWPPGD